jgi:hypothetical protein
VTFALARVDVVPPFSVSFPPTAIQGVVAVAADHVSLPAPPLKAAVHVETLSGRATHHDQGDRSWQGVESHLPTRSMHRIRSSRLSPAASANNHLEVWGPGTNIAAGRLGHHARTDIEEGKAMTTTQDYQAAEQLLRRPASPGELVIGDKVRPQWIDGGTFWYAVSDGVGRRFHAGRPGGGHPRTSLRPRPARRRAGFRLRAAGRS